MLDYILLPVYPWLGAHCFTNATCSKKYIHIQSKLDMKKKKKDGGSHMSTTILTVSPPDCFSLHAEFQSEVPWEVQVLNHVQAVYVGRH